MTSDGTDDLLRRMDDLLSPGVVSRDHEFPDAMRWSPPPGDTEPTGPPLQDSFYDVWPDPPGLPWADPASDPPGDLHRAAGWTPPPDWMYERLPLGLPPHPMPWEHLRGPELADNEPAESTPPAELQRLLDIANTRTQPDDPGRDYRAWARTRGVAYPGQRAPRPADAAGSRDNPSLRSAVDAAPSAHSGISRAGWDALARTAEQLWITSGLFDAMQAIADAATAYTRTLHEIHDIITNNPSQPPVHTRHLNATAQQRITQARSNRGTGPTNPHRHDGRTTLNTRPHRNPQPWAKPHTPPPTTTTTPDTQDARPLRGAADAAANSGVERPEVVVAVDPAGYASPVAMRLYTSHSGSVWVEVDLANLVDPAG